LRYPEKHREVTTKNASATNQGENIQEKFFLPSTVKGTSCCVLLSTTASDDMPYRYREDIATADVAFEAWGHNLEEMFVAAADATMNVMITELSTIARVDRRTLRVVAEEVDMLLFELLQELIFYKDAERLLLRVPEVKIEEKSGEFWLSAEAYGEELDPGKHDLIVDVKAVTLHRFKVGRMAGGWEALVILDV
jgi:SHS2 domain-containing protein